MKSFAVKEMWRFSQLQLKEIFFYGKRKRLSSFCFYVPSVSVCSVPLCQEIV